VYKNKSLLTIILIILSPYIFAEGLSYPAQLNDSHSIKDKQIDLVTATESTSQNNSGVTANKDEQHKLPANDPKTMSERQAVIQKGNRHKVGPVPDEPNVEPMCSHAL